MATTKPLDPKSIKILMLEDNRDDADLALLKLKSAGFSVQADIVRTASEFKELVSAQVHDLILCDFTLPGWNGLEALRWVRKSGYSTPFIYVSGTLGEEVAVECLKEGATDYVIKNRLERLPMAVHRAIEEETLRSERDGAVRQLRESEERFATAFRSSPESITISNLPDGRYIEVNDTFLKTMGYERSELIGKTATELGIWVDLSERMSLLTSLRDAEFIRGHQAHFRTRSGVIRLMEISAERMQLQGETCLLSVTRDVTDMKLLEQQFLQAQKMEAVGRLAGGVAHDFNNMLMIVGGCSHLLKLAAGDSPKTVKYVDLILDATEKSAALTRQLLAFSRQQVLQPKILDLNEVVFGLWNMLPRLIGEDIEMERHVDPRLGKVSADLGQIEQIVMNLAVNARDAMPSGGRLTIRTENVDLDKGYGQRHGADVPAGRYVMLALSDSGTGMTDEVQARLFEPFFTTKEVGKGTGLGLATVYGIVKQSNGYIWVYSEIDKGSVFKIYLPRVEAQLTTAEAAPTSLTAVGGSETILLVEDMDALREFTSEYLESMGYTVLKARDGAEALKICREYPQQIHLLLTDMVMPGLGGFEVAKEALALRPNLHVICVSGYTDRDLAKILPRSDAIFIQKPFSMEVLAQNLRLLLDQTSG